MGGRGGGLLCCIPQEFSRGTCKLARTPRLPKKNSETTLCEMGPTCFCLLKSWSEIINLCLSKWQGIDCCGIIYFKLIECIWSWIIVYFFRLRTWLAKSLGKEYQINLETQRREDFYFLISRRKVACFAKICGFFLLMFLFKFFFVFEFLGLFVYDILKYIWV